MDIGGNWEETGTALRRTVILPLPTLPEETHFFSKDSPASIFRRREIDPGITKVVVCRNNFWNSFGTPRSDGVQTVVARGSVNLRSHCRMYEVKSQCHIPVRREMLFMPTLCVWRRSFSRCVSFCRMFHPLSLPWSSRCVAGSGPAGFHPKYEGLDPDLSLGIHVHKKALGL